MNDQIAKYRAMLEKHPHHELARFSLGKSLFDAEQFPEARQHLEHALARKPDWMVVQILIGRCAVALGDREGARAAFARALQLAIKQSHDGPRAELEQLIAGLGPA